MRERPVVLARRRRRWPVRSGRAFRVAEYSSRRACPRARHRPPDIPSSRLPPPPPPRFPAPARMADGGRFRPPERHPVLAVGDPVGKVRRLPVPVVKGRGGVREVVGHQALLVRVQHHRSPDVRYLRSGERLPPRYVRTGRTPRGNSQLGERGGARAAAAGVVAVPSLPGESPKVAAINEHGGFHAGPPCRSS